MAGFHDEINLAREMGKMLIASGATHAAIAAAFNDCPELEWDYFADRGNVYGKRNEDDQRPVTIL